MIVRVLRNSLDERTFGCISKTLGEMDIRPFQKEEIGDVINEDFDMIVGLGRDDLEGADIDFDIDESVELSGDFNVLVKHKESIIAYNTIIYGFNQALYDYDGFITGKDVLLIGKGRYADSFAFVLESYGTESLIRVESLDEFDDLENIDAIINASMDTKKIDIERCRSLKFLFDYRYSPLKSDIIIDAKLRGIKCVNGIYMKSMESIDAIEKVKGEFLPDQKLGEIHRSMILAFGNIVFIGMPASGKSSASSNLSNALSIEKYDSDQIIEDKMGISIKDIFKEYGEEYFRELERKTILELSMMNGIILSPGGGAILREENAINMMRNGYIIFLNRDIEQIKSNPKNKETRPLLQKEGAVDELFKIRYPLYKLYSDYTIRNNGSKEDTLKRILEHF